MASGNQLKDLILRARTVEHQYRLEGYTEEALKSILPALDQAQRELLNQIELRDFRLPPGREDAVLEELNDLTLGIQNKLTGDIKEAAYIAGEYSGTAYNSILSFNGAVSGFNTVALSADQLKAFVDGPVDGKILSEWISNTFESGIPGQVKKDLLSGVLKGSSTKDIVNSISVGMNNTRADIITLTRTWIADSNNRAAQAVYEGNADIIDYEEWNATLEVAFNGSGTCLRCAGWDGKRWPMGSDHIRPPLHMRCRCYLLPVTKSYRELGLDIDEMKTMARPYTVRDGKFNIDVGGKRQIIDVGQFQGEFKDFLGTRSVKYQKDLLGPNRYRLLQEGKIKWNDIVDGHGNLRLLKKNKDGKYIGLE